MFGLCGHQEVKSEKQFCREVKSEPARVEPLKVDIDWDKWRIHQRSVREYQVADSEHSTNARTDWLEETESIRKIRYDIGILSDGFRPEYS
jgi:hypothetical protein